MKEQYPENKKRYKNGALVIEPTGEASVAINKSGLPAFEALVPCPFQSPDKREKEVSEAVNAIFMQGYYLTGQQLVKNEAFDKRGEKTTTKLSFRICKDEDEADFVLSKVKAIVEKEMKGE